MAEQGLVSVVTATYNMAEYIAETLESILGQDYPRVEAIVVDDGSTDNTTEVLRPYVESGRIRLVQQANAGQTVAKNRGIAEARGEFIAFCDADDTWRPDKLTHQVAAFATDPEIAVVFSDVEYMDCDGKPQQRSAVKRIGGRITAELMVDNFIPFPTTIVRADILRSFGGFDESLKMSIDYDLWLRLSVEHVLHYIPLPLARYRIWDGQMSRNTGVRLDNFFTLLERFLSENPGCVTPAERDRAWAHAHVTRGLWHAREGRNGDAWRDFRRAMGYRFFDRRLWFCMLATAAGRVRK